MGFDNDYTLNIQSLPGEYFCPVCRTLVFPNAALQSQCSHLYCKLCLAYIVATTHACPYDGYLVTEADSKPLLESNQALAETIGSVQVYCLYHMSGCQWQGTLSDCINHSAECGFGNFPVVCNICRTQIVHRQVQEHAQTCPGLQPQGQQVESSQGHISSAAIVASTTKSISSSTNDIRLSVSASDSNVQILNQPLMINYPQTGVQAPMAEQCYHGQQAHSQAYYQQYPGYDPNHLQYQYGQYELQQHPKPYIQIAAQQVIRVQQRCVLPQPRGQGPFSNAASQPLAQQLAHQPGQHML